MVTADTVRSGVEERHAHKQDERSSCPSCGCELLSKRPVQGVRQLRCGHSVCVRCWQLATQVDGHGPGVSCHVCGCVDAEGGVWNTALGRCSDPATVPTGTNFHMCVTCGVSVWCVSERTARCEDCMALLHRRRRIHNDINAEELAVRAADSAREWELAAAAAASRQAAVLTAAEAAAAQAEAVLARYGCEVEALVRAVAAGEARVRRAVTRACAAEVGRLRREAEVCGVSASQWGAMAVRTRAALAVGDLGTMWSCTTVASRQPAEGTARSDDRDHEGQPPLASRLASTIAGVEITSSDYYCDVEWKRLRVVSGLAGVLAAVEGGLGTVCSGVCVNKCEVRGSGLCVVIDSDDEGFAVQNVLKVRCMNAEGLIVT